MIPDSLTVKYLLLALAAIWGSLAITKVKKKTAAFLIGTAVFLVVVYLALGSGFSIRLPFMPEKMEVIVYTIHNNQVHALAHPLGRPGEPVHIVFSIDPNTEQGLRMRKSFFDSVRELEEAPYKMNIVIDTKGFVTDQGEFRYRTPRQPLPPKIGSNRE